MEFNPTDGIEFLPIEKRSNMFQPKKMFSRSSWLPTPIHKDYLWTIALTMGRVSEINRLIWDDVYLDERYIILYTRKKRAPLTPSKIPMPEKLHEILSRRFEKRDKTKQWVFWHRLMGPEKSKMGRGAIHGPKTDYEHFVQKGRGQIFSLSCFETFWGLHCSTGPMFPSDRFSEF